MSEYQDQNSYNQNSKYNNTGSKSLYRFDISMRVIEVIDLEGDLYTCLRFQGLSKATEDCYILFINSLFKLFYMTAILTTNAELLSHIEAAFHKEDISLYEQGPKGEPINANLFMNLFEDYLKQLKDDGIYDPTITKYFMNAYNAWEGSLG
ncbi:MAG TPA: hypothetical protein HA306_01160 [Methanosarcina sp.]|nr:hypothetical protein [Methanosarcina sp.]